jgi:hypothetical protein
MIAISVERIAAIIAGDRDLYAALTHFVDRREAAPSGRPSAAPVLKIKIYDVPFPNVAARIVVARGQRPAHIRYGMTRKRAEPRFHCVDRLD